MGRLPADPERRRQEGKLIAAVRRWAGGGDAPARRRLVSPQPTAADWAELGGGTETPAATEPAEETGPEVVQVWPAVWPVFELFIASERSWRYPPMGGPPVGLDWTQVRALADGYGVAWERRTLDLLRAAEGEAAGIWLADWKRRNPPKS